MTSCPPGGYRNICRRVSNKTHFAIVRLVYGSSGRHVEVTEPSDEPRPRGPGMACARVATAAPALLHHVNILLAVYAGAGLATGARLKWDPSTYVMFREVLPAEYRAAAAVLPAAAALLLLLAHVALLALRTSRLAVRRAGLITYAVVMGVMLCCEAALVWWVWRRAARWAKSPAAAELRRALRLREHLVPLLEQLAYWHPLPTKIQSLVQEAEEDAPRNVHVALAAAALLALLQALAVLLALLAAAAPPSPSAAPAPPAPRRPRPRPHTLWHDHSSATTPLSPACSSACGSASGSGPCSASGSGSCSEKRPPRVVYRNGRLMVVDAATTPHSA